MCNKLICGSFCAIVLGGILSKCGIWIGDAISIIGVIALIATAAFLPALIVLEEPKEKE